MEEDLQCHCFLVYPGRLFGTSVNVGDVKSSLNSDNYVVWSSASQIQTEGEAATHHHP
jgi:hypothetical protein